MNLKAPVSELIFVRNGNAPSSKNFKLKLNTYSVLKYLILESQNNIFPNELLVTFNDFAGNTVRLKASLFSTEGNIQKWELDPVLTEELFVVIDNDEASIINATPVYIDSSPFYKSEDVDTRILAKDISIQFENGNRDVYFNLSESKIVDRVKIPENGDFELYYSVGENGEFVKINSTKDNGTDTYTFLPIMMKSLLVRSVNALNISLNQNTDIYIFNYISFEIDSLFTDKTFTALKENITYNDINSLKSRVNTTAEYIYKLDLAKKLLSGTEEGKEMIFENSRFNMWREFLADEDISSGYVEIEFEDIYGNVFKKEPIQLLENKVVFEPFFAKSIKFKVFGLGEREVKFSGTPIVEDFYSEKDDDTRVDKNTITATSGCGTYAHLVAQRAIDGDESTNFHSSSYSSTGYGDVYFNFSNKQVLDRVHILTRSGSLGRIHNYTLLYKESSTDEWMEVGQCIMDGMSGNWRNIKFSAVLVKELCVRVTKSNDDHVLIYESEFF
ncbi:MAG: discoidin domain-containing protein, partial [Cetobacterium sp.]